MTIDEAVKAGISRLRLPSWNDKAYVTIDLMGDKCGPWMHLYDCGMKQDVLLLGDTTHTYEEYTGETSELEKS